MVLPPSSLNAPPSLHADTRAHRSIQPRALSWQVIRKRRMFLQLATMGKRWVTPLLVGQYLPPPQPSLRLPHAAPAEPGLPALPTTDARWLRYGITVTKKTFPKAVDRNRMKRRVRAALSHLLHSMPASGIAEGDYVVIVRSSLANASFTALCQQLEQMLCGVSSPKARRAGATISRPPRR